MHGHPVSLQFLKTACNLLKIIYNFFFILLSDPATQQVLNLFDLRSSEDSICEVGNKGECPGPGEVCCAKPKIIIVDPKPKCSDHEDFSCVGIQVSYFVFTHDQIDFIQCLELQLVKS